MISGGYATRGRASFGCVGNASAVIVRKTLLSCGEAPRSLMECSYLGAVAMGDASGIAILGESVRARPEAFEFTDDASPKDSAEYSTSATLPAQM
jgi:hypothetical protein